MMAIKMIPISEMPDGGGIDIMGRCILRVSAARLLTDFQNYLCTLQLFSKSLLTIKRSSVLFKNAMAFISFHFMEQKQLVD